MTRASLTRRGLPWAGLLLFVAAWEAAVRSGVMTGVLVPAPSALPAVLASEVRGGFWHAAVLSSLGHYLAGLVAGSALGLSVGLAVALSRTTERLQAHVARLLRPIPPLAWIPFAIIWFGVSEAAATFIIAVGIFWLNYFATIAAVRQIDPGLHELAHAFGHCALPVRLRKIILPAALPGILVGLRQGLGQGWMTVVAAELFGIAGVGQRMMEASGMLATGVVVVYMLTIAMLYGLSDLVFQTVSRRLLAWMP